MCPKIWSDFWHSWLIKQLKRWVSGEPLSPEFFTSSCFYDAFPTFVGKSCGRSHVVMVFSVPLIKTKAPSMWFFKMLSFVCRVSHLSLQNMNIHLVQCVCCLCFSPHLPFFWTYFKVNSSWKSRDGKPVVNWLHL